jgi:hypothetical protein
MDRVIVEGDFWRWESGDLAATAAFEPPALAWLNGGTLLVVATEGDGLQRATVLDGGTALVAFDALNATGVPRYEPSLAVTGDGIYLAWSEPETAPDGGWTATLGEVFLQKLVWTGSAIDASAYAPIPLPREDGHRVGDQHLPVLAAFADPAQPAPGGAVLCAWNDRTSGNYSGECPHGDVAVEVIPTPVVRGLAW